jgi:TolB-like protein/DNA-binding winged helix-turn-helix (wHTH) protein
MPQPATTRLAFDDVVIDLAGRRLLRGGGEQSLEPKAFDVLALLAGSPGRVFARDEILDAVWGHRHVTPGVLNRVMTLLRHALGEDALGARYLHTVHGVGYRFDLPLPLAVADGTTGLVDAPTAPSAARSPQGIVQYPQRRASDRSPSILPAWRPTRTLLLGAALLGALALALVLLWPRVSPAPATQGIGMPHATPTLVVLPLKPIGSGEGVRTIADGLSEELISSLARIDGLRVIARESTRLAAAETRDPTQLVQRLGITHLLEGSLQQAGQSLRIHLRLIDARENGTLWTGDFDRDASEVLLLQREVAESVAGSLALKMGLADAPTNKGGDTEFLRRLLAARSLLYRPDLPMEQSIHAPETQLRALLGERPDDARTHEALAVALSFRAMRQPYSPDSARVRAESVHEATLAQRLDPSLPDAYLVLAVAACARDDWEQCFMQFREADAHGAQMPPAFSTATLMARLGYLDRAEAMLREQLARDPLNGMKKFTLGRILDTLGRHDEARKLLFDTDTGRTIRPGYGRWFNAYWRGDRAGALRIAEQEIGEGSAEHGPLLKPGYIAASRAMADPARWSQVPAATEAFERKTGLLNFVRLLAPDAPQHAAEFIHKLGEARAKSYSTWDLLLWTKDLAWLRRDPAFQDYLRDSGILAYWKRHGFPQQCRPQGDGADCE